jgi:transcriptional regulator with XRE-family HTH domain
MGKPPKVTSPLGDRLVQLREGKTRAEFAELIGVHVNTLGGYERGERSPDLEFLTLLRSKTGVNINWLALGDGTAFEGQEKRAPTIDTELFDAISKVVRSLHDNAKIKLPLQATNAETLRHYNAIAEQMMSGSEGEKALRLGLLEIQIRQEIEAARAAPGAGKRPGSSS